MKHIQIVRVPWSWPSWGDAGYYGRRWFVCIGPVIIFVWQMTEARYESWCAKWFDQT